ncbi:MAG: hypothetical protein IJ662_09705 [Clostridia bacterium]|nr:hypothetical protein [Clostridia bacterium]
MTPAAGPYTGCDLGDMTPLCMPWRKVNDQLKPEFSYAAAALSLELASTAYDMQIAPWRSAGWRDFSYLIDGTLLSGPIVNGEAANGEYSEAQADHYQRQAAALIKRQTPISLLRGTLRQRESSDTCKCLVMIHPAAGGRYVAAIGFMGTGRRIYDWFSNFRMDREEETHKGFLQLTREFESHLTGIEFPQTARELGLARLTLADIFQSCRRPGSRFRVWMAGHSQGGAIMQLSAFREIRQGMLRQNLIGYGFASPHVMYASPGCDLSGFPLFHILNGDDVTPRVGALLHVGRCMIYRPDEEMRRICYGSGWNDPLFRAMFRQMAMIHDGKSCSMSIIALLQALESRPDQESIALISKIAGSVLPDKLLAALGSRTDQFLRFLIRRSEISYARATGGEAIPQNLLAQYQARLSHLMAQYGAQPVVRALFVAMGAPHRLRGTDRNTGGQAAYQYIVTRRFGALRSYPNSGSVPRGGGRILRSRKAPPVSRYRRSVRRNQSTIR